MEIIFVLIGFLSGMLSALGVGGGTLLIIFLTNLLKYDQKISQFINLIYFIPTSIAAIYIYVKNKKVDYMLVCKLIISAILGVIIGNYFFDKFDSKILKKFFGVFLLIIGMYEFIKLVKNKMKEYKKEVFK